MKKQVSFAVSVKDAKLINRIVVRAASLLGGFEKIELAMDLTAVHANGNRLRLSELLAAPDFDFVHDIDGIRRHLNRNTGALEGFFTPRYTVTNKAA
jgi:hypothetical protein